jgi:CBS domain-containing protein
MKVRDVMSLDVEMLRPNDTLQTAAQLMADLDAAVLPVGEEIG